MELTKYIKELKGMSNEDLIDEIIQINQYSPEDMTPEHISNEMCDLCRTELLNRLNNGNMGIWRSE